MSNGLPQIQLKIEGMRHTVIHHLSQYNAEVEEAVAQQLDHIINNFDVAGAVRQEATRELEQWIKRTVSWAIHNILRDQEVLTAVQDAIRQGILASMVKEEEEQDGEEATE